MQEKVEEGKGSWRFRECMARGGRHDRRNLSKSDARPAGASRRQDGWNRFVSKDQTFSGAEIQKVLPPESIDAMSVFGRASCVTYLIR